MSSLLDHAGLPVAFLTQHGKEKVVSPVLSELGCTMHLVNHIDTDQFGTFTREIARPGNQLEAAREKARAGMTATGLRIGVASEGSFAPDPYTGLFMWNVEVLLWVDDTRGIEVVGMAQGAGHCGQVCTDDWQVLESFARRMAFPEHHLVLRPHDEHDARVHKGISSWDALRERFAACQHQASSRQVFAESDLRAFANPSRMRRIGEAAQNLLKRLRSICPVCEAPGYWVTGQEGNLPCGGCGLPTREPQAHIWQCVRCEHRVSRPRTDRRTADPQRCVHCNP